MPSRPLYTHLSGLQYNPRKAAIPPSNANPLLTRARLSHILHSSVGSERSTVTSLDGKLTSRGPQFEPVWGSFFLFCSLSRSFLHEFDHHIGENVFLPLVGPINQAFQHVVDLWSCLLILIVCSKHLDNEALQHNTIEQRHVSLTIEKCSSIIAECKAERAREKTNLRELYRSRVVGVGFCRTCVSL